MNEDNNNPDYQESKSVLDAHPSVAREKEIAGKGNEPVSLAAFFGFAIALIAGGLYLGVSGGSFGMTQYQISNYQPAPPLGGVGGEVKELPPFEAAMKRGKSVYTGGGCNGCHQANGGGIPGQYPPLDGSEWVTAGTERIAQLILNGIQGPITVKGQAYVGVMPAHKGILTDQQIADVITYIRASWSNGIVGDPHIITPDMVKSARDRFADRATPYTVPELSSDEVYLPGGGPEGSAPAEGEDGGEEGSEPVAAS
ncbi:MAG: cytochrome c [Verrucomicrobiota bacterium]